MYSISLVCVCVCVCAADPCVYGPCYEGVWSTQGTFTSQTSHHHEDLGWYVSPSFPTHTTLLHIYIYINYTRLKPVKKEWKQDYIITIGWHITSPLIYTYSYSELPILDWHTFKMADRNFPKSKACVLAKTHIGSFLASWMMDFANSSSKKTPSVPGLLR